MKQQQLLLVDEKDTFLGKYADRDKCHTGKGLHHRAFIVLLENDKGEVLLQKRKHALWDGYWDITATTHPLHTTKGDETYQEAANRCLKNEMGIPFTPLIKQGGFNYFAAQENKCENEYCAVLTGLYNGPVKPDKKSVYEYKWMKKEEFIKKCLGDDKSLTPWAILTGKLLDNNQKSAIPMHVAMIMDGNRRWAKSKNMHQFYGHKKGYEQMENVIDYAKERGVQYVTFWAFSTENWNRTKEEIQYLFTLFRSMFSTSILNRLMKKNVKVQIIGDITKFPKDIQEKAKKVINTTKNNTAITTTIALNYGGR